MLSAAVFCGGVLVMTSFLLTGLFRQHVESRFDSELQDQLVQLVSIAGPTDKDKLRVDGSLSGALFTKPFSGWAWQIRRGDDILQQSLSLGPILPGVVELLEAPRDTVGAFTAPGGILSRGLSRDVRLPAATELLTFAIARPQSEIDEALQDFNKAVLISLGVLGVGLVATNFLLMRMALKPLSKLRTKVARMREGKLADPVSWPSELQPIADELDDLQTHVTRLVERSRGQAADLAHAVKTPLAVLHQLAARSPPSVAEQMQSQVDRIGAYLNRHLGRSRAAGKAHLLIDVAASIDDILFALSHHLSKRGIEVERFVEHGAKFAGDEADFYELVGNLMDNASKWAGTRIEITASIEDNVLRLSIADDGPGVPPDQRDLIFARGTRLDEAAPGQGLGLTIVRDVAGLYQGEVTIGESSLGGAAVSLTLPGTRRIDRSDAVSDESRAAAAGGRRA